MPQIQVLDPHLADLIAAGEVVERPASVVKELVENAIDAGAGKITVEITHGGLTFLRVTDDGGGIPPAELATAFLRHATSKLRTPRDLEAIGTLGFRGEALAAISAVSRIQATSRRADCNLGATLSLEGGVAGEIMETGCPLGTTIIVRDLFYNTPARLKFMKKDASEGAAVFAAVQRLALSHPEVGVTFLRDGKQELLTPGDGDLKNAVYAVLGRELALGFLPVKATGESMSVTGFVSLPTCCRGSRSYQHFFVNGRYVKSPTMMAALEQAYQNRKMVGKFPGCVLHLELKPSAVDVNVHPAKTEVKFGSDRDVFSALYHGVLAALDGDCARPAALTPPKRESDSGPSEPLSLSPPPGHSPGLKVGGFSYRAPAFSPRDGRSLWREDGPKLSRRETPLSTGITPPAPPPVPTPPPLEPESPPPPSEGDSPPLTPPSLEGGAPPPAEDTIPWRLAGEVLNTYIVVEQGDTILLIDKHAAHERMNFDRMKAQDYDPMSQMLLTPLALRLEAQEQAALLEHLPLLEQFGFLLEDFGSSLLVRQAPFDVAAEDIPSVLSRLAQRLMLVGQADPAAARDGVLHSMACKAAIKGGWKTSPQELERLVRAVMSGQVKYCPHGRPVAIEMTRQQLERRFGRA